MRISTEDSERNELQYEEVLITPDVQQIRIQSDGARIIPVILEPHDSDVVDYHLKITHNSKMLLV